ncbi:UvrD-helicase domain-containing protein [Allomuricauda sp. SCSIO 65647]|uniref:UvrD-helicase domain-containing protein n=1 Tax=Allomuricauda sp. SCSIO 65647 TaxID=2908843 RepID=UPI001F18CA9A|nr:UvrD-helicase domain-containing protein [Muricauda sp. SCSIO 65647]UJH69213.1 UvrD-helicase domain-containing protein [Muricauda sp. SCSIO 65647]
MYGETFTIFNASAGSGKTYQLVKNYLKLLLDPNSKIDHRHLLAITFTNKAVGEMKERILGNLQLFSRLSDVKESSMAEELCNELSLSNEELVQRSRSLLKVILHNYSLFEISTIDRVTHNIIRTFARDLKISQNFEVVLDVDLLLEEAIARLLDRAGTDQGLTRFLLDFSFEKIEANKSWNIFKDLFETGKLLFQEVHSKHLKHLKDKNLEDFLALQKKLRADIRSKEIQIKETATEALRTITSNDLGFSDFKGGYFPKFMQTLKDENFNINFDASWKQNFEETALYNKTATEKIKERLDALHPRFIELFNHIRQTFWSMTFLQNCYKNIVPMTVLNEISKEVKAILAERDLLPISEFNTIIADTIKNEPVPFIYERLGEKFRHYFIDEFQDTSEMQWKNLVPLIANALEGMNEKGQKGSLTLLGDVKQSIYRWRGGEAEQFLNLINLQGSPFVVEPSIEPLASNWRSHEQIIKLNNSFFSHISRFLHNETYQRLYSEGSRQKIRSKKGGFVEISFLEKNEAEDEYCKKVIDIVQNAIQKKYGYGDICILVRDNQKAASMANFLKQQNVPLLSPDSLLLKNNETITFLLALLTWLENSGDQEASFEILKFLLREEDNLHESITQRLGSLTEYLSGSFGFDRNGLHSKTVYDILELAIAKFDLWGHSDAYIFTLLDEAFSVQQNEGSQILSFLEYWRLNENKISLSTPEGIDAVQIMTVHKAKGLEFELVIFPYADSKLVDTKPKKLWMPVNTGDFLGFDRVLLNSNKKMAHMGNPIATLYQEELEKAQLDAFNVLYVAMTRAINALYILCPLGVSSKPDNYSGLFKDYLLEKGLWQDGRLQYSFGSLTEKTERVVDRIPDTVAMRPTAIEHSNLKIAVSNRAFMSAERKEAISKGNLVHDVLSQIKYGKDVPQALANMASQHTLAEEELVYLQKKLDDVVQRPELSPFFSEDNDVFNEQEIITAEGNLLRPDRIVIKKNKVSLIDYKTGSPSPKHQIQLNEYAKALTEMGLIIEKKVLLYINDTITPIFV